METNSPLFQNLGNFRIHADGDFSSLQQGSHLLDLLLDVIAIVSADFAQPIRCSECKVYKASAPAKAACAFG
jgi:hypothetical protein